MEAIAHKDGPMMVLAGPGSGKTLVITERTKYLIERHGVHPANILVITFTKASAVEMQERFNRLVGNQSLPVVFGTFHSIFFGILRHAYHYTGANILREDIKKQYIKEIINHLELEFDDEADFIANIINEISRVKSDLISLDYFHSSNCSDEIFKKIYESYDNRLQRENKLDFDDMLVFTYELLKERQDILQMWQRKYAYILIDEFQDVNKIQYEIIKMLSQPRNNLFIVGDDDQSIYRFRGASPEIMLGFLNDYTTAKQITLDVNYRCSGSIVEGAKRVIKNNTKRYPKDIKANKEALEKIDLVAMKNQHDENRHIIDLIQKYNREGILMSEMAVIFRTNTQPRLLIERLMEYNIPFRMRDGIPNLYEHWISKNIITYIEVARGSRDRDKFLRIINRPKRYMSREYFTNSTVNFLDLKRAVGDKIWMYERIDQLEHDLMMLSTMSPYAAINYIRKVIGYETYLEEYAVFRKMKVDELYDTLDEIQESAKGYQTYEEWFAHIEEYGQQLKEQMERRNQQDIDGVMMTTMHSSKGLEFEAVFIIDANEEITPHKKSVKEADIEEERRMFYVAMTRAKRYLHIYTVEEVYAKKMARSRFVGELLFDQDDLVVGTVIRHKKYGKGTITYIDESKMSVHFVDMNDTRTLSIAFLVTNELITIE